MRRPSAILAVLLAAWPAWARDADRYMDQVPLLPLAETGQPDIEEFAATQWPAYWRASGAGGIGRDDLRAGRMDLDGDGQAELVLMIVSDAWEDGKGRPLLIATWRDRAWRALVGARGDTDSVFTTREVLNGWRTLDTGPELVRWTGKTYRPEPKP